MDTVTALKTRRSIRRFTQEPVAEEKLDVIMECARFYPTAANLQPLKFALLTEQKAKAALQHLRWAGYLPGYRMEENDLPTALILILGDRSVAKDHQFSAGAAANQIMLAAHSLDVATCCLGMSDKTRGIVLDMLGLDPERFDAICFVALGNSTQTSQAVDMDGSCKYWLDENEDFLVPKRTVDEIFLHV